MSASTRLAPTARPTSWPKVSAISTTRAPAAAATLAVSSVHPLATTSTSSTGTVRSALTTAPTVSASSLAGTMATLRKLSQAGEGEVSNTVRIDGRLRDLRLRRLATAALLPLSTQSQLLFKLQEGVRNRPSKLVGNCNSCRFPKGQLGSALRRARRCVILVGEDRRRAKGGGSDERAGDPFDEPHELRRVSIEAEPRGSGSSASIVAADHRSQCAHWSHDGGRRGGVQSQ